jgi:hypothetical protein
MTIHASAGEDYADSVQLVQQRLGLLQISGIKPFGEPLVDGGQQVVGFFFLTLLLPQPG